MFTEFASLQLSREELEEVYEALLQRSIVEQALRNERGQEPVDASALLRQLEHLLHMPGDRLETVEHQIEDDLWEHAWYAYTEEWAWYRAQQDAEAQKDQKNSSGSGETIEKMMEMNYRKNFERYIAEIDMLDHPALKKTLPLKKPARSSRGQ
ncbi:hypothetical protein KBC54_03190 [Patescibacteria group bacterium]|nr:hypothetical protein [Patescibacteria group bacterium]